MRIRNLPVTILLTLTLACSYLEKDKSENKYPHIPSFPETSNSKYIIKKLSFSNGIRAADNIYQNEWNSDSIAIRNSDYNFIKSIRVVGTVEHIDFVTGEIFTFNDSLAYKYAPPDFICEKVARMKFTSSLDSIETRNPDLETGLFSLSDSIDNLRLSNGLLCAIRMSYYHHIILRYSVGDYLLNTNNRYIELKECAENEEPGFSGQSFIPFDKQHLGYSFDGSNHIAIGIVSDDLYYYRYVLDRDTVLFKSSHQYFKFYKTSVGRVLILDGTQDMYEIKKIKPD